MSENGRRAAEAAEQLQRELLRFQERFVAVLGHDLRNPLSAVNMAAGILAHRAESAQDNATLRVVTRIESSTRRMARMVEQIMDLSRSRLGGGFDVHPAPTNLCVLLEGVIEELRITHQTRTFELQCPPFEGLWDRDRLEQVFSNLIGNAIHHGLATEPITIRAYADGELICVDVHNQGPPIREELQAKLFDPFRRGERSSRETRTAGLGLGLFISRELVAAHGGDISIHSSAEHGATFRVALPRSSDTTTTHTESGPA